MLTDGCGTQLSECQGDRLAKHPEVKMRKWGKCPEERRENTSNKCKQAKQMQHQTGSDRVSDFRQVGAGGED